MKRVIGLLLALASGAALAQVNAGYVSGQVLTASSLNFTFTQAAAVANGTLTNPTITGGSITGLTSPLPVASGGTAVNVASGVALDNITGFSGTGFLTRTGAGAYSFQSATNGITFGNLAQAGANTVLANPTGSTANLAASAVPSCSTSASALSWTSGTGFGCNTAVNAAQLGGATFASPGAIGGTTPGSGAFTTLSSTGTFTPSQTNGIVGTTTSNNANAGSVGEYISNSATGVSLTSGTAANVTSISLTAGDWLVYGNVVFSPAAATTTSGAAGWASTTSASVPAVPGYNEVNNQGPGSNGVIGFNIPELRMSLAGTTTVFLSVNAIFSGGTETAAGNIAARRLR